jgi:hypothetical protein
MVAPAPRFFDAQRVGSLVLMISVMCGRVLAARRGQSSWVAVCVLGAVLKCVAVWIWALMNLGDVQAGACSAALQVDLSRRLGSWHCPRSGPATTPPKGGCPSGTSPGACAAAFLARSSLRYSRLRHRRQAGDLDTAVQCSSLALAAHWRSRLRVDLVHDPIGALVKRFFRTAIHRVKAPSIRRWAGWVPQPEQAAGLIPTTPLPLKPESRLAALGDSPCPPPTTPLQSYPARGSGHPADPSVSAHKTAVHGSA